MIYCENIVNVALFFLTPPQISKPHFSPPFSVMPLPQLLQKKKFPYFGNGIATISLSQIFFVFSLWALNAHFTTSQQELSRGISVSPFPKFIKKYEREEEKWGREKMLNFGNVDTKISLPNSVAWVWEMCVECPKWKEKKKFVTN